MSIFSKVKDGFVRVSIHNGKSRARVELLRMSDRQLEDFGFSKELLLQGVNAWPWRNDVDSVTASTLSVEGSALKPSQSKQSIKKAIDELNSYSDRELAELGVTRHGIEEAVRNGRPTVEGAYENQKGAFESQKRAA